MPTTSTFWSVSSPFACLKLAGTGWSTFPSLCRQETVAFGINAEFGDEGVLIGGVVGDFVASADFTDAAVDELCFSLLSWPRSCQQGEV